MLDARIQQQEPPASVTIPILQECSNAQDVHSSTSASTSTVAITEQKYCYCKEEKAGEMISCDGEICSIAWLHVDCLRIKRIPKTKLYLPDCKQMKSRSKKKNT